VTFAGRLGYPRQDSGTLGRPFHSSRTELILTIVEGDFPDVDARSRALGLRVPTTLAILPRNFETATKVSELLHEDTALTVRKLWRAEKLAFEEIEPPDQDFPTIQERDLTWVGPTMFVATSYLSTNPAAISVALGIIANYVTELFKGVATKPKVRLKVVVSKSSKGITKQLEYEGDPDGLRAIADAVKEIAKNDH
jgi:hypothetical protein